MSLFLGTADLKKITGRQGRAVHKTSHLYNTCYFPNYGNNLRVEADDLISNQLNLLSGCGLVDGCVVEENNYSFVPVNDPGDYKAYIEVNLTNDTNPQVKFDITTSSLIQNDLTINPNGIHQAEVATFTFTGGSITNLKNTLPNGDLYSMLNSVLDSRYRDVLELNEIPINDSQFDGMIFDQAIQLINNKINNSVIVIDTITSSNYPNLSNIIAEKHQGELNVSFTYFKATLDYPSVLEIRPNGTDYCYRYVTDNSVSPTTKYGDYCRESLINNNFSVRNTGNYINKLKETTSVMKIGFFGDSLTRGYDITSPERTPITYTDDNGDSLTTEVVRSYPEVLINDFLNQIYPGRFVFENLGWSGGTVEDLYKRYWKPRDLDACLIMIGTNDESKNLTPDKYELYYSAFIERQLYYGVMPIIVGSISRLQKDRQQLNTYRMIAKKLADKYNLYYVDGGDISANMDNTLYSDFIHLNTNGYAYLGRVLSVPLIEDSVSNRQRIRSRDTILFNSADNIFVSERPVGYSAAFPTPTVTETGGGSGLLLNPGQKCYVPFVAEEDALYIIPQIFFDTVDDEVTLHIGEEGKVPQAKNAYYEINIDLLTEDIPRYGRWRKTITESMKNYRLYNVFNMIGAIENNDDTDNFVMCGQKGEQLLVIENTSDTTLIRIHLLEFLSEKEYLIATKKSGTRFYKDGTSADPLLNILED